LPISTTTGIVECGQEEDSRRAIDKLREELLQRILGLLSGPDLLLLAQTCRSLRAAVLESKPIQRRVGLLPATEGSPVMFPFEGFYNTSGFGRTEEVFPPIVVEDDVSNQKVSNPPSSSTETACHQPSAAIKFTASLLAIFENGKLLPNMGFLLCRMLLTNPPVKSMTMVAMCCHAETARHADIISGRMVCCSVGDSGARGMPPPKLDSSLPRVTTSKGLTVQDLLHAATPVVEAHRLCPNTPEHLLDEEGFVKVEVRFEAVIQVAADDPIVKEAERTPQGGHTFPQISYTEAMQRRETMIKYSEAKRQGTLLCFFDKIALSITVKSLQISADLRCCVPSPR
jgi:hypothetical protein